MPFFSENTFFSVFRLGHTLEMKHIQSFYLKLNLFNLPHKYFKPMDYLKHYYGLIETRKMLVRECYLEKHHIIPRGIFGKGLMDESMLETVEDEENIISLTGREHFVAHWLLHRAFPRTKNLAAAFHAMASIANRHHERYTPSSRTVEEARKAYGDLMKQPVAMYSLDGELVKVFSSTDEAAMELAVEKSNISAACSSKNKYANNIKGFQWRRFDSEPLAKIDRYSNRNSEARVRIHEYDLGGNYLTTYASIREASRMGVERSKMRRSERNAPIFSKDKWYVISTDEPKQKIDVEKSNTQRRKVHQIDIKTGEIVHTWRSTREVQRVLGIANVSNVCTGKRKTMGGFIWKYAEQNADVNLDEHKRKLPRANKILVTRASCILGEYQSLREAEKKTNISRVLLARALKTETEIKGIIVTLSA